jgi:hypothetical protein
MPRPVKVERSLRKPPAQAADPRRELTPALIAEARREARSWGELRGGPYAQRSIA